MKKKRQNEIGTGCLAQKGGASWSALAVLAADLASIERQLRRLAEPDATELAEGIGVYRNELQKRVGVSPPIDQRKILTLSQLAKLLKPKAVRREPGESHYDAVARLYGWQTNEELERMLHFLESREPG